MNDIPPDRLRHLRRVLPVLALAATVGGVATLGGCNSAQAGTLLGASIGALSGQAIGRDTESTLIGTGIGAVAGYAIGNEVDKSQPRWRGDYDY